ncbi:Sec63 Brl domain-containing protein [Geranomyces variabilis]|nr:Sec63 Brl domain-containing protein [Geranomyces variabilis]KAJ3132885.1 secretory subunit [Geranomyces variabilis]
MAQYAYDETGAVFNYFLLTLLAFVLLPTTYSWAFGGRKAATKDVCRCDLCAKKRRRIAAMKKREQPILSTKFILLSFGWMLFALVAYKAATTAVDEQATLWNPYRILGLEDNASLAAINKARKALILKWHPDKAKDEAAKILATETTVEIYKAVKALTDEESKRNWDEWGHPDGKQSFQLGLALPGWLVREGNSYKVLFVYTAMFMILLPALVARWWSKAKKLNKDKIMNPTMAKFYRELNANLTVKPLMELICKADEFYTTITLDKADSAAQDELVEQVKTTMERTTASRWTKKSTPKDAQTAMQQKVYLLLVSHLLRITPKSPKLAEEQRIVAETCATLVGGLLQIAISRQWLSTALTVVDLGQMITQALYPHQPPLLQLPNVKLEDIRHFKHKKHQVTTIRDLVDLDEKEQDAILSKFLDEEQKDLALHVAHQYPLLRITKAKFKMLGEDAIIPNAIVTLIIKLELGTKSDMETDKKNGTSINANADDEDDEEPKNNWWDTTKEAVPLAHSPYFPVEKTPVWWVYFGDINQNRLITVAKVNDLVTEKTVRLQFQAPPRPGQWEFQVLVKSDAHLACDALASLKLTVSPPEAAPLQEEDDDISDPEEDSIAGQMNAMRKPGGAPGPAAGGKKGAATESNSDSEDESDHARGGVNGVDNYEDSDSSDEDE